MVISVSPDVHSFLMSQVKMIKNSTTRIQDYRKDACGRVTFSEIPDVMEMPNLLAIQLESYAEFLQKDEDPERREAKAADLSRAGSVPEQGAETETGPRFPYPDDAALRAASRSDRQLILDYFDRLNAVDGAAP